MSKKINFPKSMFKPSAAGILATILVFITICICVLYLGQQNQQINRRSVTDKIAMLATSAALLIDADQHQLLSRAEQTNGDLYQRLIAPLVSLHNAIPEIYYLYTMIVVDGKAYFILDTANAAKLKTKRELEASMVMELYKDPDEQKEWLIAVVNGKTYVDNEFFTDEFGTFVSGSAPFYNSQGDYVGFVGIDFDVQYFLKYEKQIKQRVVIALCAGAMLSIFIGYLVWLDQRALKALRDEQYLMAITDPLTDAFNRRYFDLRCSEEVERFKRYSVPFSILVLDLDFFKKINDCYGHVGGDAVLIQFTALIKETLRANDSVIRLGGEEFALILPHTAAGPASLLAERLRKLIENTVFELPDGQTTAITVSIGIADLSKDNSVASELLDRADKALYKAKTNGRNQLVAA